MTEVALPTQYGGPSNLTMSTTVALVHTVRVQSSSLTSVCRACAQALCAYGPMLGGAALARPPHCKSVDA
eukprot:scaffold7559_cov780-Prasinococcus_capsulatus_cf.AAC.1